MRGLTVECSAYEVQTAEGGLWTQLMLTWHRVGSSELCVRERARVCGVCVLLILLASVRQLRVVS